MKATQINMEFITTFLFSDRSFYLFVGRIGLVSMFLGMLFMMFSTHKSFVITMIVIGILEMMIMLLKQLRLIILVRNTQNNISPN